MRPVPQFLVDCRAAVDTLKRIKDSGTQDDPDVVQRARAMLLTLSADGARLIENEAIAGQDKVAAGEIYLLVREYARRIIGAPTPDAQEGPKP